MALGIQPRGLVLRLIGAATAQGWVPAGVRGRGVILCLHSVAPRPPGSFDPTRSERIEPRFLDRLVSALRADGTPILPLAAVPQALQAHGTRPFVCFTFDDGYRNNWSEAWPILRRWRVPFTVFLTTSFVSGTLPPCWNMLERIIRRHPEFEVHDGAAVRRWPAVNAAEKMEAYRQAATLFRAADEAGAARLTEDLVRRFGASVVAEARADAMTWDQVRELAADPLVDLGAHTVSHPVLGRLPREEAWREVRDSKQAIERELGRPVRHFAYPFGDREAVGPWGTDLVREAGFDLAVTTEREPLREGDLGRLNALPRISLDGLYQSIWQARAQMSGVPAAMRKRLRGA